MFLKITDDLNSNMICIFSYFYPNSIFWYLMHALNDDLEFYLVSCFTDWAEDCFLCFIFFFVPEKNYILFHLWNSELSLSDDRIRCIKFNVDYIAPYRTATLKFRNDFISNQYHIWALFIDLSKNYRWQYLSHLSVHFLCFKFQFHLFALYWYITITKTYILFWLDMQVM